MMIKQLRKQFLINYLFIFFIIIVLGFSSFYIYDRYENWRYDTFSIDLDYFEEDYLSKGLNYAIGEQNFQEEDYVIVMDSNRTIVDQHNSTKTVGYTFGEKELQEIVYGDDYYNYAVYYSSDGSVLFLLYIAYMDFGYSYIITILIIAMLIFAMITMVFAKFTSNQILHPILSLVNGVQSIGKGDYDTLIAFDASDELNILKDEINHMTAKLKEETHKREQLESNRKKLIRDISHDIRTPLTNILGYSDQLIQENKFVSPEQQQSIEIINQYGVSANHLISELFDLSRLELDEDRFETHKVDIVELIRLKCIDYYNEFEKKSIDFHIDLPDTTVMIDLHQIKFQRVLDNLIQNSLKYNKRNFAIAIALKEYGHYFELILADNGIGIPEDYSQSVFQAMVRVEDSRNRAYGGSGLGLSIVKQIIDKHGWSVELANKDKAYFQSGCTFMITMPK